MSTVHGGSHGSTASRFALNIRARRELSGLSQRELAQALVDLGHASFRQQTIAEVESGGRQVKLDEALALARALGITVDSLIRPAGLTRQAGELLTAAREAQEAARQAARWAGERELARHKLQQAIETGSEHETELAGELTLARRALAETGGMPAASADDRPAGPDPG